MSNNPLPDSRLDSVFDIIAGLRRQMLNTEDSAGQQRIWEVIKNYQKRQCLFCNEKETMSHLFFCKQDDKDDRKNLI